MESGWSRGGVGVGSGWSRGGVGVQSDGVDLWSIAVVSGCDGLWLLLLVAVDSRLWLCVAVCGCAWLFVTASGCAWLCVAVCGRLRPFLAVVVGGVFCLWPLMGVCGCACGYFEKKD